MNARILEIFKSTQGEGKYVGAWQIFVRFFECNMHCVWCDTPHSIGDTTLEDLKFDGGIGFRLAWNLSTIVSFDFGRSSEGSIFYMLLGHQF